MKNSFIVEFAVSLWLKQMGIGGPLASLISFIAKRILGDLLDKGIIILDLSIDSISQAMKESEWREAAQKAYSKAQRRVLNEGEKHEIRREYLDALSRYATLSRVSNDRNSKR